MSGQCLLDITKPETWKPCGDAPAYRWSDLVARVSDPGRRAPCSQVRGRTSSPRRPGLFQDAQPFRRLAGQYVIHCHILAHEDRGMMTIVEVVPFTTAYSHK